MIKIDPTAFISKNAEIEDSIRGSFITIGPKVVIDSFVKIKPAGGNGNVFIGENTVINSGCIFYSGNGIKIGRDCLIAANCILAPVNHNYLSKKEKIRDQGFQPSKGGIIIEDDVWIGANCVVLDGSILRKGCVVGAMSLVRGEVSCYTIQAGNPLKQIGNRI